MKISLIIPAYNAQKTLARCLDSVIAQNYEDMEVLVIDDGSTDGTYESAQQYQAKYPFIHCQTKENGGVSTARNAGLRCAKGDYITFLDSDDELEPDLYHQLDSYLAERPDLVTFSIKNISKNNEEKQQQLFESKLSREEFAKDYFKYHQAGHLMSVCNKLIIRTIAQQFSFEEGRISGEDYLYCLQCYTQADSFHFVPIVGYRYYSIDESASHSLFSRYDKLHELDSSLNWRRTTDRLIREVGVKEEDLVKYHQKNDPVWFYYMVKNILNPGTPYHTAVAKVRKIRDVMDVEECRVSILGGGSGKLSKVVKLLYRINSAWVTYLLFKFAKLG